VSNEGISGVLRGTADLGWNSEPWRTDIAAMDGGLQLALLWSQYMLGGNTLPMAVGLHRNYGHGLQSGPIHCVLRGKVVGNAKTVSTLQFRTEDGEVLAELHDVETILIPGQPARKTSLQQNAL
jgi:hypothetical protein